MRARQRPDPEAAAAARRRLQLLGAELSASVTSPVPPAESAAPVSAAPVSAAPVSSPSASVRSPPEPVPAPHSGAGRHAREVLSLRQRCAARLADSLPPTFRGRLGVTSQHVTIVALALAAALAAAAWFVLGARVEPLPPAPAASPPPLPPSPSALPSSAVTAPEPTAAGAITSVPADAGASTVLALVVDVAGKVRRPGIVELPVGARVIDALEAAGGARPGVDLTSLNLARALVDGEQIVVGTTMNVVAPPPAPSGAVVGSPSAAPVVNLNSATPEQLDELPGVGPVTSASIIDWRTEHGGFTAVEELLEVSGIGEVTLAELRPYVTV
jgi:competence protein ComEA